MSAALKTPLAASLPAAVRKGAGDAQQLQGKALPASVVELVSSGVVRIKFEVESSFTLPEVTIPILAFEYVRFPIQRGCKGLVVPANAYLGAMSGLGGGTATLTQPANLGALAFMPVGNKEWSAVEDGVLTLYGVEGVTILDADGGSASIKVKADSIKAELGGAAIELAGGEVRLTGKLVINGDEYLQHTHDGVTAGGATSGPVT